MFAVATSMVDGRFIITFLSGVGQNISFTASTTSTAYSGSVQVKLSGEYSYRMLPFSFESTSSFTSFAPSIASCLISSLLFLNTTSRCRVDVELYKCTIAFFAPSNASIVFSIICSRACVSTWIDTSSGILFSSIRRRTNSNSVPDAAGNPTSISLKPSFTR